jgi:hypothetical protein
MPFGQIALVAINDRLVVVPVAITVVILLDDHSVPIPMFVAIADDRTVAISIAVTVMPGADRYARRSDSDSDLFRTRRHCSTNARNSGNNQSVFHRILLALWKLGSLRSRTAIGSGWPRQTLAGFLRNDF